MKKRIFLSCLLAVCAMLPTGCSTEAQTEVAVLKVGKADAILILSGSHTVLIDAGEEEDADEILSFLRKRNIGRLDAMIITHYDKDHVGGADGVLKGTNVAAVYDSNYESDSVQYHEYLHALEETGVPRTRVTEATELTLGNLAMTLLPTAIVDGDDNDNSLVVSLHDGMHSFFFAADATEARIAELLEDGVELHDVLKMPHHGRYEDNLGDLLDAVSPRLAIITDSEKNPAEEGTLALLEARGVHTRETKNGDIHVYSEAKGLSVDQ